MAFFFFRRRESLGTLVDAGWNSNSDPRLHRVDGTADRLFNPPRAARHSSLRPPAPKKLSNGVPSARESGSEVEGGSFDMGFAFHAKSRALQISMAITRCHSVHVARGIFNLVFHSPRPRITPTIANPPSQTTLTHPSAAPTPESPPIPHHPPPRPSAPSPSLVARQTARHFSQRNTVVPTSPPPSSPACPASAVAGTRCLPFRSPSRRGVGRALRTAWAEGEGRGRRSGWQVCAGRAGRVCGRWRRRRKRGRRTCG